MKLILIALLISSSFGVAETPLSVASIETKNGRVYNSCKVTAMIEPTEYIVKVKTPGDEVWYVTVRSEIWKNPAFHKVDNGKNLFLIPVERVWADFLDVVPCGFVKISVKHDSGAATLSIEEISKPETLIKDVVSNSAAIRDALVKKVQFMDAEERRVAINLAKERKNMEVAKTALPAKSSETVVIESHSSNGFWMKVIRLNDYSYKVIDSLGNTTITKLNP